MTHNVKVARIHLKPDSVDRNKLLDFCLHNKDAQYVVVGWSCAYEDASIPINTFSDYYQAVIEYNKKKNQNDGKHHRMSPAINIFSETKENDLFWTRDMDGNHWICRAKGPAEAYCDYSLDIGARVPVEAYMCGLDVPGQIRVSFTRPRGGISESFYNELIITYSQYIFNKLSGRNVYEISYKDSENIIDNLPPFDLEELVISYIQIQEGYYVLSNSIANKSTTIKIECEFRSRDKSNPKRAVVQVKGGKHKELDAKDYKAYIDNGYTVYFFAPTVLNTDQLESCIWITREQLLEFYQEYKSILPESITKWESLFD